MAVLTAEARKLPKVNILGVGISAITMPQAVQQISDWVDCGAREYVSVSNVHTVMECQGSDEMRRAVNGAGMATPDGMPLVWLGGWKSGLNTGRVYGPDLMLELCKVSVERGYSHYFYGGKEGVPEELAKNLQARFPGLKVAGAYSPPFRKLSPEEHAAHLKAINDAGADIVWVGLGTPKQDLWMGANRDQLRPAVLIAIGAAFDFHTGRVPQAPRLLMRLGMEWLFRLFQEPRRLWYRYLVFNPLFVMLVLAQTLGLRRYKLD